jgi:drug/metabolite transporter (DMT)-like permease
MTYVCCVAYMYALLVNPRRNLVTKRYFISGIGGKFQTYFLVQKVSGLCYCSEATQGRIPLLLLGVLPLIYHRRFTSLSGMYFSLQYLSLSDAVVLKFLAPILTGFSGVIFLKESLSLKEVVAGSKHFMKCLTSIAIYVIQYAVLVELS